MIEVIRTFQGWFGFTGSRMQAEWVCWLTDLLGADKLGVSAKAMMTNDDGATLRQRKAVLSVLEQLAVASEEAITQEVFAERFRTALDTTVWAGDKLFTQTVSVRAPAEIEQETWEYVFIIGMNGESLPEQKAESGIFCDADRIEAGLLASTAENDRAQAALFHALNCSREKLILAWSRLGSDGRVQLASPFIQRLKDNFLKLSKKMDKSGRLGEWQVQTHQPREILAEDGGVLPDEYDIACHLAGRGLDDPAVSRLNEWISPRPAMAESSQVSDTGCFGAVPLGVHRLKPSKLNAFGECPYKYFAQNVLGLERPSEIDLSPDSAETGTMLHGALEEAVNHLLSDDAQTLLCCDENELSAEVKQFKKYLSEGLVKEQLGTAGLSYLPAVTEGLQGRWLRSLQIYAEKQLFVLDKSKDREAKYEEIRALVQEKIQKDIAQAGGGGDPKKEKKREQAAKAQELLAEFHRLKLEGRSVDTPEQWPDGFKGNLNDLVKLINEVQPAVWLPLICEWNFSCENKPLEIDLGNGKKAALYGQMDRVDVSCDTDGPALRVIDYKSGESKTGLQLQREVDNGVNLQLVAYILAIDTTRKSSEPPTWLKDYTKATLTKAALIYLKEAEISEVVIDIESARALLRQVVEQISTGALTPRPADPKKCPALTSRAHCDYAPLCRAGLLPEGWFEQNELEQNFVEETK